MKYDLFILYLYNKFEWRQTWIQRREVSYLERERGRGEREREKEKEIERKMEREKERVRHKGRES
jgi:hypothetical protein